MKNLIKEVIGSIYGMGVYCFKNLDGNILYVGSGMLNDRLQTHVYNLKRGLYEGTNKEILQKQYNLGNLSFEVLHFSENNTTYLNGTDKERKAIQDSLEVLEQFYYDLYKDTCCNVITKIHKRSTSPNKEVTLKRRMANAKGSNPNNRYDEELVANILYLKEQGLKPKKIVELLIKQDIDVNKGYISQLGINKWIGLESKCPEWYEKDKIAN